MRYRFPLVIFVLLALAFAGCSKHSPEAAGHPKISDLGVVEVSDGVESKHDLGDGKTCYIKPTVLKDGNLFLALRIEKSGEVLMSPRMQTAPDQPVELSVGNMGIRLTPHIKQ